MTILSNNSDCLQAELYTEEAIKQSAGSSKQRKSVEREDDQELSDGGAVEEEPNKLMEVINLIKVKLEEPLPSQK